MAYFKNYVKTPSQNPPTTSPPIPTPVAATPQPSQPITPTQTPTQSQPVPQSSFKQAPPKTTNYFAFLKNPWFIISGIIVLVTTLVIIFLVTTKFSLGGFVLGAKTQDASAQVLDAVGKLTILPSGKASVANITGVEQLRARNPFFNSAKNGDKLIVYATKIIIYRPTENKIVDMSPVNVKNDLLPSSTPTPSLNPNQNFVTP